MKTSLLLTMAFLASFAMRGQTYNSCVQANNASTITAGTYSVGTLDGTQLPSMYCDGGNGSGDPTGAKSGASGVVIIQITIPQPV